MNDDETFYAKSSEWTTVPNTPDGLAGLPETWVDEVVGPCEWVRLPADVEERERLVRELERAERVALRKKNQKTPAQKAAIRKQKRKANK